jgi:3-oxoacyl-[acyl-carrier protein] reductase
MSYGPLGGEEWIDHEVPAEPRVHPPGMRFAGVNAIVTGAGRGFGSVIALALAKEGANVVVTYNTSLEGAKSVSEQIKSMGRKSMTVKVNIMNWEEVKSATERVWKEFGPIDLLVNNAAEIANDVLSWRKITEESIDHTLNVDVKGTMLVTHEVWKRMFERRSGTIVNIASHVIAMGTPRAPQYAAGKEGVIGPTKSYALAFAPWVRARARNPLGHPSVGGTPWYPRSKRPFLILG